MPAPRVRLAPIAFLGITAFAVLPVMQPRPARAQSPADAAVPAAADDGTSPEPAVIETFPPMEGEGDSSANGLLTGKVAWDASVGMAGEALVRAVLGRDFTRADLAAVRLHLVWDSGTKWMPGNAGFSYAVPGRCQFDLDVDGASVATWKAPCTSGTLAFRLPSKTDVPAGRVSVTLRFLDFKPSKGADRKLPVSKARLLLLYAAAGGLSADARPSRLFQPHRGAARLLEGDRYSWQLGEWVKVKSRRCDVPCEAECACRFQVQGSRGVSTVPTGDVIGPTLRYGSSGDWLVASTRLEDVEYGAPCLYEHAGIVADREGRVVRLPTWWEGALDGGCGDQKACLAICPDRPKPGAEVPMLQMSREFGFREEGRALILTATDKVQDCGKEGVTKSRVTRYRVEHDGNGLVLAPVP